MNLTSDQVISIFEEFCEEYDKIFVPDPRQDAVLEKVIAFYEKKYDEEILRETIREFVRFYPEEAILIFDFAVASSEYRKSAIEGIDDRKEVQRLMKETEERMKRFNEL